MKSIASNGKRGRKTASPASQDQVFHDAPDRSEHIAVSAYYKAQARGFVPGQELDDWLEAERELGIASAGESQGQ